MIAILYEKPINDSYIIEMGTNVGRKQGLRTHQASKAFYFSNKKMRDNNTGTAFAKIEGDRLFLFSCFVFH